MKFTYFHIAVWLVLLVCPQAGISGVTVLSVFPTVHCELSVGDTTRPDTLIPPPGRVALSEEGIDSRVDYDAEDLIHISLKEQKVYLRDRAIVKYESITMTAGYMVVDLANNLVVAEGIPDSNGTMTQLPQFEEGSQVFSGTRISYNFKTHQGHILGITTKQGDLHVTGAQTKFLGKQGDPSRDHDIIYNEDALVSTCDADHKHFGIRSRKQKVIPGKMVIVGPSNLEIADIPTPLWLPFGFFPITNERAAGLIFPKDYEYSPELGYGLANLGYFLPINPYMNASINGDIYLRGTWRVMGKLDYRKRYKFNGNFSLQFADRRQEAFNSTAIQSNKSIKINWRHNQDPKAHPYNTLGGNIDVQTNNFESLNNNDFESATKSQLTSNLSFNRNFPNSPFVLNASFQHSQNTQTRQVTINFPNLDLRMRRIFPFKKPGGGEQWFEKISLTYSATARNQLTATDTTLFSKETLENAQYGFRQDVRTDATFRVAKFFNITPFIDYKEDIYFKTLEKTFDPNPVIDTTYITSEDGDTLDFTLDTLSLGTLNSIQQFGPKSLRQYNAGVSLFTTIYGTALFKKGWLRGIRHVMQPSLTFGYAPDYTGPAFDYFRSVQTPDGSIERYSIFDGGAGLRRPSTAGQNMQISYGIDNNFEAKVYSKNKDDLSKIKLFNRIGVRGSVNLAADSLQFSPLTISGPTTLFNGMTTVNINAQYDYYALDEEGRRINTFYFDQTGKPLRFVSASATFNTTVTVPKLRQLLEKNNNTEKKEKKAGSEGLEDLWKIINGLNLRHNITFQRRQNEPLGLDTLEVTVHTLALSIRRIALSPNWGISIGNISYNFKNKNLFYPDFTVSRNLHCWEMGISWQPARGTYNFYLRVRPGSLGFLEIPYKKNNIDSQFRF